VSPKKYKSSIPDEKNKTAVKL